MLILGDLLEHIDECEVEVCNGSGTTLFVTIQVITDNGEKTIWNVVDIALLKLEER